MKRSVLIALALAFPMAAFAQSSSEYALMGATSWSALRCSALARVMEDRAEQERLFNLGYEKGQMFLKALHAGKVLDTDVEAKLPMAFILVMSGPNPDFVLGRAFEYAHSKGLEDIYTSNGKQNPKDIRQTLAQTKFTSSNCALIR